MNLNIKTIVSDFEKRVSVLKKEVDGLEKKKANYEADIEALSRKQKELNSAVADKSKYLAGEVAKAVNAALEKLKIQENEVVSQKEALVKDRGQAGILQKTLDEKIKETDKLKVNLQTSIREYLDLKAEVEDIKNKLEKTIEVIKGVFNG
ncbi:MAG: hypothetical protein DRP74_02710 [Candidatus Omnitrophota bacterium]|nr:MAG: hypothetical protein DRP74_02710 [Candidatus Omnitrophota bacterium]